MYIYIYIRKCEFDHTATQDPMRKPTTTIITLHLSGPCALVAPSRSLTSRERALCVCVICVVIVQEIISRLRCAFLHHTLTAACVPYMRVKCVRTKRQQHSGKNKCAHEGLAIQTNEAHAKGERSKHKHTHQKKKSHLNLIYMN